MKSEVGPRSQRTSGRAVNDPGLVRRPIVFSGMQPSGGLTIGNYTGALRSWIDMQESYDCLYCIADLHTATRRRSASEPCSTSLDLLATYLACGVDPVKCTVFAQSHVPAHAQLHWLLSCYTRTGELTRMHQFSADLVRCGDANAGLLSYPVLMAADVLLYQTDYVPVGEDQRQHLELIRRVARRFNRAHGTVFTVPEVLVPSVGMRIMSLTDPTRKMSKSDDDARGTIFLLDGARSVDSKIRQAVTDSDSPPRICFDPDLKPGISNLLSMLSGITGESLTELESKFAGKRYDALKSTLTEVVLERLDLLQRNYRRLRREEGHLREVLRSGAERAGERADRMLLRVHERLGFIRHWRGEG